MSLRVQIVIVLVCILSVMGASMAFIASRQLIGSYTDIEMQQSKDAMVRIRNVFDERLNSIHTKSIDWSNWDDLYAAIQTKDPEFIKSNLSPSTAANLQLTGMYFTNAAGTPIFGVAADNTDLSASPSAFMAAVAAYPGLEEKITGMREYRDYELIGSDIYMVSLRPIVRSDGSGPAKGSVIFVRRIDSQMVKELSGIIKQPFQLERIVAGTRSSIRTPVISNISETEAEGAVTVSDTEGTDIFQIKTSLQRQIVPAGKAALGNIGKIGIFLSILLIGLVLVSEDRLILVPLVHIVREINLITKTGAFDRQIHYAAHGEVRTLVAGINNMLQRLNQSQQELVLRTQALSEAKEKTEQYLKETQEKNDRLNDTKQAMLNILADAQDLERSLAAEKERAQAILTSMAEGMTVIDRKGLVLYINPAAERLYKPALPDVHGKSIFDLYVLEKNGVEIPQSSRYIHRVLDHNETISIGPQDKVSVRFPDGSGFPVAFTAAPLTHESELMGAVLAFQDISAIKEYESQLEQAKASVELKVQERTSELLEKNEALERAQQQISEGWLQLEREKARLMASINGLDVGFILADADGKIVVTNGVAKTVLDLTEQTTSIGDLTLALMGTIDLSAMVIKSRDERTSSSLEDVVYRGKYFHFHVAPIFLATHQDEYLGTVILIEDRTDSKLLNRARDEFFSIASHELRTPLTAIRGNTSMILDYYKDKISDPDLHGMLDDIHESSVRLISIVNEFLNMSRLEQKKISFKLAQFNINELVEETVKELEAEAKGQGLALLFKPEPGDGNMTVMADRDKTKEVLINLIGNAIKYTEMGSVTVVTAHRAFMIEVAIQDTGRGVSLENQPLLFRKFQQAGDNIYTRDTKKSTGLGLYISKLIVEGMGGTIRLVSSEPGKGSTFAFTLQQSS